MSIELESNIDIESYLKKQKSLIDEELKNLFKENNYVEPQKLWDAVRYSVLEGGKRIRGILCLATNESLGNLYIQDCLTTACSIEIIHAMSLMHDDLPCMDNDDFRRGKPSCHKAYGEATAILAGDAMLTLSLNLIAEKTSKISQAQKLEIINVLAKAFSFGLVPGQILDLSYMGKSEDIIDFKITENISRLKTAELFRASVICGAIISKDKNYSQFKITPEDLFERLSGFGLKIGTAFQIVDDILDITGDTKTLGKTSGKDEKQKKATYPMKIGIENSKKLAKELVTSAKADLEDIQLKNPSLFSLANHVINRIN